MPDQDGDWAAEAARAGTKAVLLVRVDNVSVQNAGIKFRTSRELNVPQLSVPNAGIP